MPIARDPDNPQLTVRFRRDFDTDAQRVETATSFAAFWQDQFGTIHFTAVDEDFWSEWFDSTAAQEAIDTFHHDSRGDEVTEADDA